MSSWDVKSIITALQMNSGSKGCGLCNNFGLNILENERLISFGIEKPN